MASTSTANPTAVFQHYVQNCFKFPKEIKNDIVYCQRALKAHIKVHQMVLDVYKMQGNPNPAEKHRIIEELESQIYEINAEQQFLLLRLRRLISDFHKNLERKGVHVVPNLMNDFISSEVVPLINDPNFLVYPTSVRYRSTEEKLIEKYFEMKKEEEGGEEETKPSENYFEILDSDEEDKEEPSKPSYKPVTVKAPPPSNDDDDDDDEVEDDQMSLLKPMEESPATASKASTSQFVEVGSEMVNGNSKGFSAITSNITVSTLKRKSEPPPPVVYPVSITASKDLIKTEIDDGNVPQNVKMSRLNLRQVLKNVQSEKASSNQLNKATTITSSSSSQSSVQPEPKLPPKIVENNVPTTFTLSTSSSDDSTTPERCLPPAQQSNSSSSSAPTEKVDTRMSAEEYGQEMFLRIFGLFTPEMHLQLQQRRSKRKRRTVQSNARSDYHYGHIEYRNLAPVEEKKKRKEFLLSPQVKRKLGRPPKRRSVENVEKSNETTSRSGSSSPDEKRSCNQCTKVGGALENCDSCKRYFHPSCHANGDKASHKAKMCPPCRRQALLSETHQQKTLKSSADKLKHRLTSEKSRRRSLQQKSESFKMQMNALFNIIKAIKNERNSLYE